MSCLPMSCSPTDQLRLGLHHLGRRQGRGRVHHQRRGHQPGHDIHRRLLPVLYILPGTGNRAQTAQVDGAGRCRGYACAAGSRQSPVRPCGVVPGGKGQRGSRWRDGDGWGCAAEAHPSQTSPCCKVVCWTVYGGVQHGSGWRRSGWTTAPSSMRSRADGSGDG